MITIYGKENCPWCVKAKTLAETYQLKYEYKNAEDPLVLAELKLAKPDVRSVPQIWWYGRHIGGYKEFSVEVENTKNDYGQGQF